MTDKVTGTVSYLADKVTSTVSYLAATVTGVFSAMTAQAWGVVIGAVLGVATLGVNTYYQRRRDRREQLLLRVRLGQVERGE